MNIRKSIISTFITILVSIATLHSQVPAEGTTACAESNVFYGVTGLPGSEFIWVVEGGDVIAGQGTDTVEIRWGYDVGEKLIEVYETTAEGCGGGVPTSIATITLTAPLVDIGPDVQEACQGETIILDASGNYELPYSFLWSDSSRGPTYDAYETEDVWVRVTDGDGCSRTDYVQIVIHPLPEPYIGNDTVLCDNTDEMEIDAGYYAEYYWTSSARDITAFQQGSNPIFLGPSPALTDTISVTVTDFHGCQGSDELIILPCDIASLFKDMPNTITPGTSPGENDEWVIPYINFFPKAELEVFDRWGRLVFRSENVYEQPWDGKSKGTVLPMDSYYYVLKLNFPGVDPIVGTVNIVR